MVSLNLKAIICTVITIAVLAGLYYLVINKSFALLVIIVYGWGLLLFVAACGAVYQIYKFFKDMFEI